MKTLLLDNSNWDILLDAGGNLAIADAPYQLAQDVASALKLFSGELFYNTANGIPYLSTILGFAPPLTVFQEYMVRAAMTVPGVVAASCTITAFENRAITGQVVFTTDTGLQAQVSF